MFFDRCCDISIPTSAITGATSGCTVLGSNPALCTSNWVGAYRRTNASAIWLRAELWVHNISTFFRDDISEIPSSPFQEPTHAKQPMAHFVNRRNDSGAGRIRQVKCATGISPRRRGEGNSCCHDQQISLTFRHLANDRRIRAAGGNLRGGLTRQGSPRLSSSVEQWITSWSGCSWQSKGPET